MWRRHFLPAIQSELASAPCSASFFGRGKQPNSHYSSERSGQVCNQSSLKPSGRLSLPPGFRWNCEQDPKSPDSGHFFWHRVWKNHQRKGFRVDLESRSLPGWLGYEKFESAGGDSWRTSVVLVDCSKRDARKHRQFVERFLWEGAVEASKNDNAPEGLRLERFKGLVHSLLVLFLLSGSRSEY